MLQVCDYPCAFFTLRILISIFLSVHSQRLMRSYLTSTMPRVKSSWIHCLTCRYGMPSLRAGCIQSQVSKSSTLLHPLLAVNFDAFPSMSAQNSQQRRRQLKWQHVFIAISTLQRRAPNNQYPQHRPLVFGKDAKTSISARTSSTP